MNRVMWSLVAAVAVSMPFSASANDFLSDNTNDWFRYVADNGSEKQAQISQTYGNWKQWSDFAGQGTTWVYSAPSNGNYFWIWTGGKAELITDLTARVGAGKSIAWGSCNQDIAYIGARGDVDVPAGTFSNAVELKLRTSCADGGVNSIWFAEGVGIIQWTEMSIAGPVTYKLNSAQVDGKLYSKPAPKPVGTRPVAVSEHADMETIMWGANDTYLVIDTYTDAFKALASTNVKAQVMVDSNSVASDLRYELTRNGVDLSNVEFLVAALDSVWMRDYGPIVMKRPNGDRVVADAEYYYSRPQDDNLPKVYASYRGWDHVDMRLSFEGGNFATDGRGNAMITTGVEYFNDRMTRGQIEDEFKVLGCDNVQWFEPLIDEGTTHIDMFARVMDDNTAFVSRYPSSHRQSRVCNDAAEKLRSKGYSIIRADVAHNYDEFATYSNSVLANGIALVPQYGQSTDAAALEAYRSAGYRAFGIDSRLIIKYSGATHCLSMQIPAGN